MCGISFIMVIMKRMLLIYNPNSGDGRIKSSLSDLTDYFTKQNFEVTVHPTQAPGDAKEQVRKRSGEFERIIVCGGDGMMHEAINGYMASSQKSRLGYIPTGTVNDFASSHDIPFQIEEAAAIAADDAWSDLDIGRFNDEFFSYVAAFGVATAVSYSTPQEQKKRLGSLAYLLNALSVVDFTHWENNCSTMTIEWEGGKASGDFLYGMVSNSKYVAGMDQFTKDLFDWRDGKLEGLFIRRPMNLMELNQIIGSVARSDFDNPFFIQVQSPWFTFSGDETAWTLDGEFGGSFTNARACAVPRAFQAILPREHIDEYNLDDNGEKE